MLLTHDAWRTWFQGFEAFFLEGEVVIGDDWQFYGDRSAGCTANIGAL